MEDKFKIDKSSIANLKYNLNYYGADYPIDSLVKRMESEEFIIPNFQRPYVWKIDVASKFIESLLLGLPVPSIFLAKDKFSNKLIVIDGQQRLRTLQFFYRGQFPDGKQFKLKNVISQINGYSYKDLAPEDRITLDNTIIHCLIIAENENSDSLFYLFERLNTTGNPLNNQEIRNAIYHGSFNEQLEEFSQSDIWKRLYQKDEIRLHDQELILRFISLTFELENYSGSLSEFLNAFMLQNRNFELISKEQINRIFYDTLEIILESIGESAFYYKKLFKISLFETICISIARNKDLSVKTVRDFYDRLIKDEKFWQLSNSSTTSKKSILSRIKLAQQIIETVENEPYNIFP